MKWSNDSVLLFGVIKTCAGGGGVNVHDKRSRYSLVIHSR